MFYKTVSIKEVIGRIVRNTGLNDSTWVPDIYEWIFEQMETCRVRTVLQPKSEKYLVKNHYVPFPCDLVTLDAVSLDSYRLKKSKTILDVPKIESQIKTKDAFVITETSSTVTTTNTVTNTTTKETEFKYNIDTQTLPYSNSDFYKLVNNGIQLSFTDKEVVLYYLAYETDAEGIITIPDNEALKKAIYWYVLTMMIGAGYTHPVFKYEYCNAEYQTWTRRAINELRDWTPESCANFEKMWVTMLPADSVYHSTFALNN